ncbi:YjbH domain-containing protein [Vibrio porteresiae]|uniref:YjbH domain-containing protein n=1 Tax=Vibrio porteresiae DSM 19223 TaxID=1123496 RepID=A0ABZ0QEW1_9VIBR|nr:YjbH domain-containing protein [Vibrio porteresiae]WPC74302.1 YjbH domain-containing protein [Vibrio porteresiae DSM 19223]
MKNIKFNATKPWSLCAAVVLSAFSTPSLSDEFSAPVLQHSQSDFGGVGLMQMPSARMMDDGELTLNITNNDEYINYAISLQLFPWLESTIRYTQVHNLLYSDDKSFSGSTDYTDKSVDLKLNLLEEGVWLPDVSIGLRDIGGTGLFDGEYVAASKQFGPFDFTLGLGWGYIGNRGNLSDKAATNTTDCGRDSGFTSTGGSLEVGRMFTGCKALFGGIEYQTPFDPLVVKLEYDGNDYQSDFPVTRGGASMPEDTPWNVGIVYSLSDWAKLRLSYERGNTLSAGLSVATNLANLRPVWLEDNKKPAYAPKPATSELTPDEWKKLTEDLGKIAGYQEASVYQSRDTVTVQGEQKKYRDRKIAEERAALLIANTGINAKSYRIIETNQRLPVTETAINAYSFKRVADNDYPEASFDDSRQPQETLPVEGQLKSSSLSDLSYGLSPSLKQSFGASEGFYLYSLGVNAGLTYNVGQHLVLSGGLYGDIVNNYDKFKYTVPPDGTHLKRVRTLARQYLDQRVLVSNLQLTYFDRWSDNLYAQAYGGYLESMFAGYGSELLYRPRNTNWAIGVNGNYVIQRDPDSLLGLFKDELHYDSETKRYYSVQTGGYTGHVNFYWEPHFISLLENSRFKVSVGQYLTGDKGVTVDYSKQFDSGVIAGVFATKTNLSAEEYGEGSFTKGFYISIPFDVMMVKPSTNRANLSWQPLTRDGGQMLGLKYGLYDLTDARSPWFTRAIAE